jgi:putative restriction endonuclease
MGKMLSWRKMETRFDTQRYALVSLRSGFGLRSHWQLITLDPHMAAASISENVNSSEYVRWLERLSALKYDQARGIAPHKPLLLLVVCDLVEQGKLDGEMLHRTGDLAFRFSSYWRIVADRRRTKPDVRLPFFHLRRDGFWKPLEADGRAAEDRTRAVIAQLDVSFLLCLENSEFRQLARRTLIAKYFEITERAELYALLGMAIPPEDIVAADATRFLPSDKDQAKRDAKFAVRVLPAYDYTCALTGYRMIAVNGSTPLDAAHIHQFKRGESCHPTNGIALSKTAHWLFDHGFWSLSDDFRVLVAESKFEESGEATHLLKPRAGKEILRPAHRQFWPDVECLRWHRQTHQFGFI